MVLRIEPRFHDPGVQSYRAVTCSSWDHFSCLRSDCGRVCGTWRAEKDNEVFSYGHVRGSVTLDLSAGRKVAYRRNGIFALGAAHPSHLCTTRSSTSVKDGLHPCKNDVSAVGNLSTGSEVEGDGASHMPIRAKPIVLLRSPCATDSPAVLWMSTENPKISAEHLAIRTE